MRETLKYLPEALRLLRSEAGLTQAEMAERMRSGRTSITRFEGRPGSQAMLGRYLDALGATLYDLGVADQRIRRARGEGGEVTFDAEIDELRAEVKELRRKLKKHEVAELLRSLSREDVAELLGAFS